MLVLSRRASERIRLGDSIVVTVVRVDGDRVRLGIEAPSDVLILRDELERRGNSVPFIARIGVRKLGTVPIFAGAAAQWWWWSAKMGHVAVLDGGKEPCQRKSTQCPEIVIEEFAVPSAFTPAAALHRSGRCNRTGRWDAIKAPPNHPLSQNVDLRARTGGCVGRREVVCFCGREILVVTTLQNRFEHVPHRKLRQRAHLCQKMVKHAIILEKMRLSSGTGKNFRALPRTD